MEHTTEDADGRPYAEPYKEPPTVAALIFAAFAINIAGWLEIVDRRAGALFFVLLLAGATAEAVRQRNRRDAYEREVEARGERVPPRRQDDPRPFIRDDFRMSPAFKRRLLIFLGIVTVWITLSYTLGS